MKKTKEDATLTREQILDAALKVFSTKGYISTKLEEIAKEAGVTRGAIYWHFENKYALFSALLHECKLKMKQRIDAILKSNNTPLTKMNMMMTEFSTALEEEEEFRAIEEIVIFKTIQTKELQSFFDERAQHLQQFQQVILDLLKEGIKIGEICPRIDLKVTAIALISYFIGLEALWLYDKNVYSPKKSAKQLFDIFLNGIKNNHFKESKDIS